MPQGSSFERLIIVGLPRSGTTLVATLLGSQPGIQFLTDYFPAFMEVLGRLGKRWNEALSESEMRIALAVVRDQFLRVRHPVLVKLESFSNVDELHQLVMAELAQPGDRWLGHKLLMSPEQLRVTLSDTSIRCLLMVRDVRDAALSFYHRTGGGVERYVRNWSATMRLWRELEGHPRLIGLRYEDLIDAPKVTLDRLGSWLGVAIDADVVALRFQRSRAHGATAWRENSAFQDVKGRFDRTPLGRWREQARSPIVRYAGWVARRELAQLGYEEVTRDISPAERTRFSCLRALELAEERAHHSLNQTSLWLKRRVAELAP